MEHSVPYVWENSPGNDEVRIQDLSDQKWDGRWDMVIRLQMIKDEVLNFANKDGMELEMGPRLERGNRGGGGSPWSCPQVFWDPSRVQPTFIQVIRLEMGGKKNTRTFKNDQTWEGTTNKEINNGKWVWLERGSSVLFWKHCLLFLLDIYDFQIYTRSLEKWARLVIIWLFMAQGSVPGHMATTCRRGLLYKVAVFRSPTSESCIRVELVYGKLLEQCLVHGVVECTIINYYWFLSSHTRSERMTWVIKSLH